MSDPTASALTRHCSHCGAALPGFPPVSCERCGREQYNNPKPGSDAILVDGDRVLLIRRRRNPFRGYWDIPGGFSEPAEHPEATAVRELFEETGLRGVVDQQIGIYIDTYGPPQADGLQEWTLTVTYLLRLADRQQDTPPDDEALELRWFDLDDLPEQIAFPNHSHESLARAVALVRSGAVS